MIKITGQMYSTVGITLVFILLMTLIVGNIATSYQESKTLSSGKIMPIADDNNTFSDLSRNTSMQAGS
jgi:flagellar biosynthesis protein FlhB